jgi:hypothetical protein
MIRRYSTTSCWSKASNSASLSLSQHSTINQSTTRQHSVDTLLNPTLRQVHSPQHLHFPPSVSSLTANPPDPRVLHKSATASLIRKSPIASQHLPPSLSHLSRARPEHSNISLYLRLVGNWFDLSACVSRTSSSSQLPRPHLHSGVIAKPSYSRLLALTRTVASKVQAIPLHPPSALQRPRPRSRAPTGRRELQDRQVEPSLSTSSSITCCCLVPSGPVR